MINSPARALYLLFFFIVFVAIAWNKPKENYDMVFYAASAFAWQQQDPGELHKQTFAALKLKMSDKGYREVTVASKPFNAHYRSTVFQDVEAFRQQLPYYKPRFIYSGILFILTKLGLNIVLAMQLLSVSAAVLGLLVLLSLFRNQPVPAPCFYLAPWLICSLGYFDLARYSGADAIVFLLVALCYRYLLTLPSRVMWLLPFLVLIRTDLIFFVAITGIYLYKTGQKPWHIGIVLLAAATLLSVLQHLCGSYSWGTTVQFTFVDLNPYPETLHPAFTLWSYLDLLLREVRDTVLTDDRFLAFLVLAAYPVWQGARAWLKPYHTLDQQEKLTLLAVLAMAYVFTHIALFPASWERFFMAQYVLVFLLTLVKVNSLLLKSASDRQPIGSEAATPTDKVAPHRLR